MELIARFTIDAQHSIELMVPPVEEKENTYCWPSVVFDNFDFIYAYLTTAQGRFCVDDDILRDFIYDTRDLLIGACDNKRVLPENISPGTVGYFQNLDSYYYLTPDTLSYHPFWIWSARQKNGGLQSFLYTRHDIVYLEIAPSYPYLYQLAPIEPDIIIFREYMQDYKPFFFTTIDFKTLHEWIGKCEDLGRIVMNPCQ